MNDYGRCIIVSAAPIEDLCSLWQPQTGDYLIAADGGLDTVRRAGLMPDLVVGDMDSFSGEIPADALLFSSHKDDTDTMIAVKEGIDRGYRSFLLLGGLGGRLDHSLANIQTLAYLCDHGCEGELLDNHHCILMLRDGTKIIPRGAKYLSVFSFSDVSTGVTLRGVEYPLENAVLTSGFPLGVSNRITEAQAAVTVGQGTLLIVCYI